MLHIYVFETYFKHGQAGCTCNLPYPPEVAIPCNPLNITLTPVIPMKQLLPFLRKITCFSIVVLFLHATAYPGAQAILEKQLPAAKPGDIVFTIKKWGRFALVAQSGEGTALQLIDRKSGVRKQDGIPGEKNGRIDEFLDIGEYKIVATPHPDGKEKTSLKVMPFEELNREAPQYITPLKEYKVALHDFEQASYWIHLDRDTTVFIEALGRNVADVQLWLNGEWRIDCPKAAIEAYPSVETPLKGYRIVHRLVAGYYRLTVYGGAIADWARRSDDHPAYIRMEVPRLPATGINTVTISEKGYNEYFVTQKLTAVIMALPKKTLTWLRVTGFPASNPYFNPGNVDSVFEKSADPRCLVHVPGSDRNGYLVQVAGTPGDTVTLKTFETIESTVYCATNGDYWFSTIHSGFPDDQIGPSGILVNTSDKSHVMAEKVEVVSGEKYLEHTFNLLDGVSMLLRIDNSGKYDVIPGGTDMTISIRRLLITGQNTVKDIDEFSGKTTLQLEKGYYRLSITPDKKGIATIKIAKNSMVRMVKNAVGMKQNLTARRPNLQFPKISLRKKEHYTFLYNSLAPELTGTVFRKLPLSLDEALPVYVEKGTEVTVPVKITEKSVLSVVNALGKSYPCKVNGSLRSTPCEIEKGTITLTLFADEKLFLSAGTTPVSRLPNSPPRPFPTGEESPLPSFPLLYADRPAFFDLGQKGTAVYEFTIDKPGMYRFETTGRLKTSLTLRDRFVVNALSETANGVGRNARILTYLLPGTYQTQVAVHNQSAGHLGLSLAINETIDGGTLTTIKEKRHEVQPGQGITYTVTVENEGEYELISQGQSGYYTVRLDDAEGWPVVPPLSSGNISRKLAPGNYRFISIPQQRKTLRIARLTQKAQQVSYEGKGPHRLQLNSPAGSIWMEETGNGKKNNRIPAVYIVALPAPARCRLNLTEGFTATVGKEKGNDTLLILKGTIDTLLPAGTFSCRVLADRQQNNAEYTIGISTETLMAGMRKSVSNDTKKITFSVGRPGVFELFSQGTEDVSAQVYEGKTWIASNDDAPNDWNFRIARMFMPGTYTLRVSHAAGGNIATTVCMTTLDDTLYPSWKCNVSKNIDLGGKLHRVILQIDSTSDILHTAINGASVSGCQVQRIGNNGTEQFCGASKGTDIALTIPVESRKKYAVYFWSVDHTDENVSVMLQTAVSVPVTLAKLQKGENVESVSDGTRFYTWLKCDLESDSAAHFQVDTDESFTGVKTAAAVNTACTGDFSGGFGSLRRTRWVALAFTKAGRKKIQLHHRNLDTPFRVSLEQYPRAFRIPSASSTLSLLTVATKNGVPMCGVKATQPDAAQFFPRGIGVQPGVESSLGTVVGIDFPEDPHLFLVWNAAATKTGGDMKPVMEVLRRSLPIEKAASLDFGTRTWNGPAGTACRIPFKQKVPALVTVTIPKGCIAIWKRENGSRTTFTTGQVVRRCIFQETAGELLLVNPGADASVAISCIALDAAELPPALSKANDVFEYEGFFPDAGFHEITIPGTVHSLKKAQLQFSGAIERVDWWSASGTVTPSVSSGTSLATGSSSTAEFPGGGRFTVYHSAGWIKLNLFKPGTPFGEWGTTLDGSDKSRALHHSQAVTLHEGHNWFSVKPAQESHLRLQLDAPAVVVLLKGNKVLKTFTAMKACDINLPLQKNEYTIGLRGLGTTSLQNTRLLATFAPLSLLTEKEPPELLLAAGESRMLKFTLPEKRTIGIGLDTDNEVITTSLLDNTLSSIRSGQQQFMELDKGEYYLHLSIPSGERPAHCTVRLVGQDIPPDVPPAEVVNKFIRLQ
jgi:hypothetical protein